MGGYSFRYLCVREYCSIVCWVSFSIPMWTKNLPLACRVSFSIPMLIRGITLRYGFLTFLLGIVFDTYVSVWHSFVEWLPLFLTGMIFDTCGCAVAFIYGIPSLWVGIVFDTYICVWHFSRVSSIVFDTHVCGWCACCIDGYRFRYLRLCGCKYIDYTSFYCWVSKTIPRYHYMAFLAIGYRKRYLTVGNIRFLGYFCNI